MEVRVEYFVDELVSRYRIEGLSKVYYCKKCSESRIYCVKAFENCQRHVCEESVCEMVGSVAVLGVGEWYYVL